jgi:DNA-binding transcriptional LysR family regulator
VCASPGHVAQYGMPKSPEELADHAAIRFSLAGDDSCLLVRRSKDGAREHEVRIKLRGRVRADDTEAVMELVIADCGFGLLPAWSIGPALKAGKLVRLLPDWEVQATRSEPAIWGVYPPKKTVSTKVRAFLDFYAAVFSDPAYWKI